MTKILRDIIFMGTPEFALPALWRLVRAGYRIRAVYTQPDRPAGRGRRTEPPPVKRAALALGLAVYQPERLDGADTLKEITALAPDALVVAAYGQLIPPAVLASAPWGALNLHPSLLPRHRGAAPVAATILAGDAFGGVSVMQLDAGLDSGPVLARAALAVTDTETTPVLTGKLAHLGAALLHEVLLRLPAGLTPEPQDAARATYFKALTRRQGLIDWNRSAAEIARQVRALQPWPGSYTYWQGQKLEIMGAWSLAGDADAAPGTVLAAQADAPLAVQTGDGRLGLLSLKLAGKRTLSAAEFTRGQRGFIGSLLEGSDA